MFVPVVLHTQRILVHGYEIIKATVLPIEMFSEEALEFRNKHFRPYRQFYTRKFSRVKIMRFIKRPFSFIGSSYFIITTAHRESVIQRIFD